MNILFVVLNYPPERFIGAELYDHALAKKLQEQGNNVQVIATEENKSWDFENIHVNPATHPKYDLVISHLDLRQKAYFHMRKLGITGTAPLVGIIHNEEDFTLGAGCFYHWGGIIANSNNIAKLRKWNTNNVYTLIPPVPEPQSKNSRKKRIYTAFQANTAQSKGGIQAIAGLANELKDEKFRINKGGWGEQSIITRTNIDFYPHAPITSDDWNEVKTLILPSPKESWAMLASEAISYGVPVVTYDDLDGVRENLGEAAIYIPRNSSTSEWVKALRAAEKLSKTELKKQAKHNFDTHNEQLNNISTWLKNEVLGQ